MFFDRNKFRPSQPSFGPNDLDLVLSGPLNIRKPDNEESLALSLVDPERIQIGRWTTLDPFFDIVIRPPCQGGDVLSGDASFACWLRGSDGPSARGSHGRHRVSPGHPPGEHWIEDGVWAMPLQIGHQASLEFAIQFDLEASETHYGWLDLRRDSENGFTVLSWAWCDVPDKMFSS